MIRSFRGRLILSYLMIVVAGSVAMVVVASLVVQARFNSRVHGLGGGGRRGGQLESALSDVLVPSLLVSTLISVVVAVVIAAVRVPRLLRPLADMGVAARRMASGDYDQRVEQTDDKDLGALARDVNALAEHLSDTEHRRTQLMSELTHELRTPLTVIKGKMEALMDGVIEQGDSVYAVVADEAARMERLVSDLTLLSRAEEGALVLDRVEIPLADLIGRLEARLGPQFVDQGVELATRIEDAPTVVGDSDRLLQVLINLVGNALRATPPGGRVRITAATDRDLAFVEVSDSGHGIDPVELDHIFERFYRLAEPGSTAGRGIGLTIARSIARAHGGDITARSDGQGLGATFVLSLPRWESL